jgi:hypothetical protein
MTDLHSLPDRLLLAGRRYPAAYRGSERSVGCRQIPAIRGGAHEQGDIRECVVANVPVYRTYV